MEIKIEFVSKNGKGERALLSEGFGSWLEFLEFDGKVYWTVNEEHGIWKKSDDESLPEEYKEVLLPSDTTKREDY